MPRTFQLTIAYDGTDFAGWQVQPGQPTIQARLQDALGELTGQPAQVVGSGRTDAGVHALGQVASCRLSWDHGAERLAAAINTKLPESIVVRSAVDAPDEFHAIRDATAKEYRYQLQFGGQRDVFDRRYRWRVPGQIEIEPMRHAAQRFVGRHDFASFQATGSVRKTTTRTIQVCELRHESPGLLGAQRASIVIQADGFLYNMVRNIVGTLVEVGRGKHPVAWIDELLAARNRDLAGPTAPPHGLFLTRVDYPPFQGVGRHA